MVRITVLGTKHQIKMLTKAAKHTGLATPSKFLAALFDGNHLTHHAERFKHPAALKPIGRRQTKP